MIIGFKNTRHLVQRRDFMKDIGAGDGAQLVDDGSPLRNRQTCFALSFIGAAEIDPGRGEVGVQPDRFFEIFLRFVESGGFAEDGAGVEQNGIKHRVIRIMIDPCSI
ncbi:MAG: hypothetical protein P4M15_04290 [Alphaproteobacteria bacterium]|nr:hypothetical protein [Alphaproteobacteria bacterium]